MPPHVHRTAKNPMMDARGPQMSCERQPIRAGAYDCDVYIH